MSTRILCVLALCVVSAPMAAQNSLLKGLAKDVSGVPLAGVLIEAIGPDSSIVGKCVSDREGRYSVDPLPPGTYTVRIGKEGYSQYHQVGVVIGERRITFLDLKLTPIGWKAPKEPKKKRRRSKR